MEIQRFVMSMVCCLLVALSTQNALSAERTANASATSEVVGNLVAAAIDINKADTDTLTTLPGIGEKTAEKINTYREMNGPFKEVDELLNVKGIGPKVLEKIRPLVRVS